LYVQVIGDGAHVHPQAIKMILRSKRPMHILLTSDASPVAGLEEGAHGNFSKQDVVIRDHQAINQEGGLAGSSQMIHDCVKNLVRWHLTSFADAIQFATLNPATFLNEPGLGRLEAGCRADMVLWNKQTLEVETTFINGQPVYQRNAQPRAASH
jgi:N-acetylglucosamine-6-phosphate deacetylase